MRNESFPLRDPVASVFLVMAHALAPAPFQPDSRGRWERVGRIAPLPSQPERGAPDRVDDTSGKPALPVRRKAGFLERLDRWFWAQQQRDLESYLARSADIHDLEQRMRNIERSAWHRNN